ncbi:hypothetical protein IscW_ISCW009548 [Ixodes scapularis]|uniref:Uncharacterized protein n=1 Tax=Ixodes scapularis TaxID=6945 RepID=B7Q2F2_IXOSC|nr:hypothetical protein IscW_ISCW009548 [Ixodes scapularis]|eukprot:XP_002410765.1 hypothetical protein IscW_ISCW009548 [Ixodes scapularis]
MCFFVFVRQFCLSLKLFVFHLLETHHPRSFAARFVSQGVINIERRFYTQSTGWSELSCIAYLSVDYVNIS